MILAFDDGPTELTHDILKILQEYEAIACFFIVGSRTKGAEDTIRLIAQEHHEVGNHTMTHPYLTRLPATEIETEIRDCRDLLDDLTGKPPIAFRPPYVDYDARIIALANELGHHEFWLASSLGDYALGPDEIVAKAKGRPAVLLHEIPQTVEALPMILEAAA